MLKIVAGTQNQAQAEMIVARLASIGITAISQLSLGNPEMGGGGGRMVYVEERDVQRARELLAEDESPISDEELARLAEEAGGPPAGG